MIKKLLVLVLVLGVFNAQQVFGSTKELEPVGSANLASLDLSPEEKAWLAFEYAQKPVAPGVAGIIDFNDESDVINYDANLGFISEPKVAPEKSEEKWTEVKKRGKKDPSVKAVAQLAAIEQSKKKHKPQKYYGKKENR